jgi:2-methylaconitate cis-trans-isomerase PrpF
MSEESKAVPCAIYRGGTSRGVFFRENDLPYSQAIRTRILLNIFGSPDARQINGLGGATSVTSKTMIVGPSQKNDGGVDMLFGQVSIHTPVVDWGGTCGNLISAVGPFAIDQGLVRAVEPITEVRIYNINTKKTVIARVPVKQGRALSEGDYAIPGVPGTGARIEIEFVEPAGALSGRLLPTGKPCESIETNDGRSFTVSIVDAGNPVVFCNAAEFKLRGTELPSEIEKQYELMATLEQIRSVACERLGIVSNRGEATSKSPGLPKIGFVSAPASYATMTGRHVNAEEVDIVGRLLSMQTAHPSYMGAGAICTAAASVVEGTLVHELRGNGSNDRNVIRIGHPQGVMEAGVKSVNGNGEIKIQSATISRTARRIMEGFAYVPEGCFEISSPV